MIFSSKSSTRQFSHTRFIFLLIIVLNTLDTKDHTTQPQLIHRKHFEQDLKYCPKCFESQIQNCNKFFQNIKPDDTFSINQLLNFLPAKPCNKRNNQLIKLQTSNEKLIAKYFFNKNQKLKNSNDIAEIKINFLMQQEQLQGMQFLPLKSVDKFTENLKKFHTNLTNIAIWQYMINNIQLLILPILEQHKFPIPSNYAICGFSLYQQFIGQDLYNFFKADFLQKLEISKQLLESALKFSYGFDNYRLYITDLTADNIVYDSVHKKLYYIDLDTIFIVDSTKVKYKSLIHKHDYIECPGCFAYSADDIASYNISDINIYSTCQFLREDLFKDHTKGFLYPIPQEILKTYPKFKQLLNKCVDCTGNLCLERFTVAKDLIELFKEILWDLKEEK